MEKQSEIMKNSFGDNGEGEHPILGDGDDHIVQQRRMVSEVYGLMPRRHHSFPVSRDWQDIDCWATGCRWNKLEKCIVPSICKITADGRCKGFEAIPMNPQAELGGD
jgi:hypothetical protein